MKAKVYWIVVSSVVGNLSELPDNMGLYKQVLFIYYDCVSISEE
jgi:hypothetical protein